MKKQKAYLPFQAAFTKLMINKNLPVKMTRKFSEEGEMYGEILKLSAETNKFLRFLGKKVREEELASYEVSDDEVIVYLETKDEEFISAIEEAILKIEENGEWHFIVIEKESLEDV